MSQTCPHCGAKGQIIRKRYPELPEGAGCVQCGFYVDLNASFTGAEPKCTCMRCRGEKGGGEA